MKIRFAPLIFTLLVWSCELMPEEITGTPAEQLEGQWQCNETSTLYKSTQDYYTVYIVINPSHSNQIVIENFYQLGRNAEVVADIDEKIITISNQSTGDGFEIYGAGTISSKFDKITWRYYVDDGTGFTDQVDAIYTKAP